MPHARRAILFRIISLIPMFMLGKEIFYIAQGMQANHWLAKDAKPVSAIVTQAHKKSVYAYRYVVDGKEYLGHSARDWEEEKVQKLAVGEQTSVVISESHPWVSSFKARQTSWLAFPVVGVMILFECLCLTVLINPRSLSFLNVKQQPPNEPPNEPIQRFIHLVLLQAQKDGATEMVVSIASPFGVTIRYKVEDTWHEMPPFSAHMRADVVSELVRMAGFPTGQIPGEGVLDERLGHIRLQWIVAIPSADGECMLKRIND